MQPLNLTSLNRSIRTLLNRIESDETVNIACFHSDDQLFFDAHYNARSEARNGSMGHMPKTPCRVIMPSKSEIAVVTRYESSHFIGDFSSACAKVHYNIR
jgi:hypothetical protein